ncbi:aldose 1-epimerase [Streptomyces sp. 3213]|uniref:aldose 1-epimerase n=1 Tax=Streptomyces sp. 3213.3 TaxID=1855348 RepID=UPI0008960C0E|nr:aldose 1-epimerase [Streptomyces sp. 3213.3]SEC72842.1 aldose 1-epimerase [Streptomyces sp. 3213] [Streptomyces sp. 3213.3]
MTGRGGGAKTDTFRIAEGHLGDEPTVTVSAPDGAVRAVLALRGATLLSWQVGHGAAGQLTELTDGYRDEVELRSQDGVRAGLLAPFPNRVADGRYRRGGRDHDLLPGRVGDRTVYHGFAREAPFRLVAATMTPDSARLLLRSTSIRPGRYPGYPFALDLDVEYTIGRRDLGVEIRATNVGETTAPYAAGWHPYFTLSRPVDDLVLHIPAHTLIRTDASLIPLRGKDALLPLDRCPDMDFRTPRRLGDAVIDACFADLSPGPDGRTETVLSDPATGAELRVWQHGGYLHVFTGDTLARDRRGSIALEPVEVPTDAFNRPELAAALSLEPGRRREFRFGVAYVPSVARRLSRPLSPPAPAPASDPAP